MLFGEEAGPPHAPTTLEASRATDKPHGTYCNLLNNTVLARRARSWPLCPRGKVASYTISGIRCVARYWVSLYNNRVSDPSPNCRRKHVRAECIFGRNEEHDKSLCRTSPHLTATRQKCRRSPEFPGRTRAAAP